MNINIDDFRVAEGSRLRLQREKTCIDPVYAGKDGYKTQPHGEVEKLAALQDLLYAENRQALLVVFQAMDAAGKDGAIKHVLSGINPQGCRVYGFRQPSAGELEHDF